MVKKIETLKPKVNSSSKDIKRKIIALTLGNISSILLYMVQSMKATLFEIKKPLSF